jgi:hypothetical protein
MIYGIINEIGYGYSLSKYLFDMSLLLEQKIVSSVIRGIYER